MDNKAQTAGRRFAKFMLRNADVIADAMPYLESGDPVFRAAALAHFKAYADRAKRRAGLPEDWSPDDDDAASLH